jgi:hypothetical protein
MYAIGDVVQHDDFMAVKWDQKAADQKTNMREHGIFS